MRAVQRERERNANQMQISNERINTFIYHFENLQNSYEIIKKKKKYRDIRSNVLNFKNWLFIY